MGDWDDVDAAVRTALKQCQIAMEDRSEYRSAEDGGVVVIDYYLLTVRGDTGLLRVRRTKDGSIEIGCRLGVLGSEMAERKLTEYVQARLEALRGVDYAPVEG